MEHERHGQSEAQPAERLVMEAQQRAAERAETVGQFSTGFRSEMSVVLKEHDDARVETAFARRASVIDNAAGGHGDLRVTDTEGGVLGWNHIGAGRGGVHLSRTLLTDLEGARSAEQLEQVAAHEIGHGKQVQLDGTLVMDGEEVNALLLYEGHAEIVANEAISKSKDSQRDGQPAEVYGEGQKIALTIISRTSRARFERALTGDGDMEALTADLALSA